MSRPLLNVPAGSVSGETATAMNAALVALIAVLTFILALALLAVLAARAGNLTLQLRRKPRETKP